MTITGKAANTTVINLEDGRIVCQSYGVTVAAFIPRDLVGFPVPGGAYSGPFGYVRTSERYSVTTSKHMNGFAGKTAPEVPHAVLLALTAPVSSRL
jgi:hypothetical protein